MPEYYIDNDNDHDRCRFLQEKKVQDEDGTWKKVTYCENLENCPRWVSPEIFCDLINKTEKVPETEVIRNKVETPRQITKEG